MTMNSTRRIAVVAGVLFVLATASSLVAATFVPALAGADYLTGVSLRTNGMGVAALLYVAAAFGSVGIAISLYPVLRRFGAGLALGSVVFRSLEAAFYMVSVVCLLSLLQVGRQYATAAGGDRATLLAVGDTLVGIRDHATVVAVLAFCLGAFLYYTVFFQSKLVPRWLSGWGIAAIVLMFVACVLALFSNNPITGYVLLVLPIAVQEMVLAVWLIAVGFGPSATVLDAERSPGGVRASQARGKPGARASSVR